MTLFEQGPADRVVEINGSGSVSTFNAENKELDINLRSLENFSFLDEIIHGPKDDLDLLTRSLLGVDLLDGNRTSLLSLPPSLEFPSSIADFKNVASNSLDTLITLERLRATPGDFARKHFDTGVDFVSDKAGRFAIPTLLLDGSSWLTGQAGLEGVSNVLAYHAGLFDGTISGFLHAGGDTISGTSYLVDHPLETTILIGGASANYFVDVNSRSFGTGTNRLGSIGANVVSDIFGFAKEKAVGAFNKHNELLAEGDYRGAGDFFGGGLGVVVFEGITFVFAPAKVARGADLLSDAAKFADEAGGAGSVAARSDGAEHVVVVRDGDVTHLDNVDADGNIRAVENQTSGPQRQSNPNRPDLHPRIQALIAELEVDLAANTKLAPDGEVLIKTKEGHFRRVSDLKNDSLDSANRHNHLKGVWAEAVADIEGLKRGWLPIGGRPVRIGDKAGTQGIDRIWLKPDGTIAIVDSKALNSQLGNPVIGKQLSAEWIDHHLDKLHTSRQIATPVFELASISRQVFVQRIDKFGKVSFEDINGNSFNP